MIRHKPALARAIDSLPASLRLLLGILIRYARLVYFGRPTGPPRQFNPGQKEQAVLDLVKQSTPPGNPDAVLNAIDSFAWGRKGFLMNMGDVKGIILDNELAKHQPKVALELGSYIGYSAIRTARKLPPGSKLYGIDPNETHVRIAREMIAHAGLSSKVEIIQGILETSIPELHRRGVTAIDFALIDHLKTAYLKDLLILQRNGFFKKGSIVVGDNIFSPGAPDYRKHVATSPDWSTVEHVSHIEYSNYIVDIVTVSEFRGQTEPRA